MAVVQMTTVEEVLDEAEEWLEGVRSYLDSLPDVELADESTVPAPAPSEPVETGMLLFLA